MSRDWTHLTWTEQTWGERAQNAGRWIVASIIGLGALIGGLVIVGMMIDGAASYNEQHDRCLKHATNGYDIQKCR